MSLTVKLGIVQSSSQGSLEANLNHYLKLCLTLAHEGAEVIFLPELFLWDYFPIREETTPFQSALPIDSSIFEDFRQIARDYKLCLHLPIFEKRAPGLYHNSSLSIGTEGQNIGLYRKLHIPDDPGFYEKYYFAPGDLGFQVVETPKLKIGMLICWDQWFPEAARITSMMGADLLYYPTAIAWDQQEPSELYEEQLQSWQTIMRSHAIANGVYSLAVNRTGQEENLTFWGNSQLCAPSGKILMQMGLEDYCQVIEVPINASENQRQAWPFFRDRRVDQYHPITQLWNDKS